MINILSNDHYETMLNLFDGTESEIKIISPFLSLSMANKLCEIISKNPNIQCSLITRFYIEDFVNHANDFDALEKLLKNGVALYAIRGLHTKLYLFDQENAIVGSANFTAGGLKNNIELSLHIQEENTLIVELQHYFNQLIDRIKNDPEQRITQEIIDKGRLECNKLFTDKKGTGTTYSISMYGAQTELPKYFDPIKDIGQSKKDKDIVYEMFKDIEKRLLVNLGHTIWLKFDGEGNKRIMGKYEITECIINGEKKFLSCYPWKPSAVKDGDEIYLAALSQDYNGKNQPMIIGKGLLKGFQNSNYVDTEMIKSYDWMNRYPWYCIIEDLHIIDTSVQNGYPLDELLKKLGSDTYESSFGKNEDIPEVSKKHHQKAHIRITSYAKDLIDKELNKLFVKYGIQ